MHPFSHCNYAMGHSVPLDLTGDMSGPGKIVARSVTEDNDGVHYSYFVEFKVWHGEPARREWMQESTIDGYEVLKLKHERELRAARYSDVQDAAE